MNPPEPTVESLRAEIRRIVAERHELRANGAGHDQLDDNRRRLADAQARYARLLIRQHLPAEAA